MIPLLTSQALARTVGVYPMLVWRMIERGDLCPDFHSGGLKLFRTDRLAEVREKIQHRGATPSHKHQ